MNSIYLTPEQFHKKYYIQKFGKEYILETLNNYKQYLYYYNLFDKHSKNYKIDHLSKKYIYTFINETDFKNVCNNLKRLQILQDKLYLRSEQYYIFLQNSVNG